MNFILVLEISHYLEIYSFVVQFDILSYLVISKEDWLKYSFSRYFGPLPLISHKTQIIFHENQNPNTVHKVVIIQIK